MPERESMGRPDMISAESINKQSGEEIGLAQWHVKK